MASVIIPVLLCFFLGPGMGQLYNKDYKKAVTLIVISFAVLIASGVWYYKAIQPFIPSDLTTVDPQALQEILKNAMNQVSAQKGYFLVLSESLLTVLWIYGIVDAYTVSQKKRNQLNNGRV